MHALWPRCRRSDLEHERKELVEVMCLAEISFSFANGDIKWHDLLHVLDSQATHGKQLARA